MQHQDEREMATIGRDCFFCKCSPQNIIKERLKDLVVVRLCKMSIRVVATGEIMRMYQFFYQGFAKTRVETKDKGNTQCQRVNVLHQQ